MVDAPTLLATLAVLLPLGALIVRYLSNDSKSQGLPLPPGPKPKPLLGNITDLTLANPWLLYTKWGKQYGELVHFRVFGQHVLVTNSLQATHDLLDKRSLIYSDRAEIPVVELMGWDFNVGTMRYNQMWRAHRKFLHQSFHPTTSLAYRPTQLVKVHDFLGRLLKTPNDFAAHYRTLSIGILLAAVYGYDAAPTNDRLVVIAEKAMSRFSEFIVPGGTLVNIFPSLQHVPSWIPGATFKKHAAEVRKLTKEMLEQPFATVKQRMSDGSAKPSLTSELLEQNYIEGGGAANEEVIMRVAATAYTGGADTTTSALVSSMLAMVLYPEATAKAQAEIDAVIGSSRLPEYSDRESLPYVGAFYREVMRWHPATPLGVPHCSTEDDVYNGYFIPKATMVFPNVWAMTHDEKKYPEPETFRPERFLTPEGKLNDDETVLTYGFGRRICVGQYMADATVWASIVSVLSVFNIAKAKDEQGNEIEVKGLYSDGFISLPLDFRCSITPRSVEAVRLIQEAVN